MIADRVPSISASFSLNLSCFSVASKQTRLESTLCADEGSAKFFGFRHISIDRHQPCSAIARRTEQAETVIVNLTDE